MPMKATDKGFALRLPIETYEFFKEQAKKNKRSVNAEFLIAIEEREQKLRKENESKKA